MSRRLKIAAGVGGFLTIGIALGAILILYNPERVIDYHHNGMDAAAEVILSGNAADLADAEASFEWHRDQLVRLGAIDSRTFTADSTLIDAVIEKSGGLPVCSWHPEAGGVQITVWGTEEELRDWESLISARTAP